MSRSILSALGAAVLAIGVAAALPTSARAQAPRSRSVQTEAVWIAFDAAAEVVTVKVTKPGRGASARALKPGREARFRVEPEGSVLTRTTVSINGRKGELSDIPEGKTVNVYWVPDETDADARFARKIDVIFSDEELDAMYPDG